MRATLLSSFDNNTFEYNANGIRTKKNDTTYELDGTTILSETTNDKTIRYYYANSGIVGFIYNNVEYYYQKNIQGDITAIYREDGTLMGKYVYDAWGNCTITTDVDNIATLNPFRYRSYYFDTETGLYYLNSRYYAPDMGRFISPDSTDYLDPTFISGLNLYAYCINNPVMYSDGSGCSPEWWQWVLSGLSLAAGIACCFIPGGQVFGVGLIVAGASGLISNTMDAMGIDGKIASLISSGLSIITGIALCFTPFAGIGAGLIGQGVGSVAGGYISEALGGSFGLGATLGGFVGSIVGGLVYRGVMAYRLSHMSAYEKGVMGERYVKALYGNKVYKPTTGANRPDLLFKNGSALIEVKNVASQGLTHQLNRYLNMGYGTNIIYVRLGTRVSSALGTSGYVIKYLPW